MSQGRGVAQARHHITLTRVGVARHRFERERIQSALSSVPLFAELEAGARAELPRCARLQELRPDQVVIERGDAALAPFAVVRDAASLHALAEQH